jgi:hypothetical protein
MGPTGCPETSVLNQPTLRNNPEDGRILQYLASWKSSELFHTQKQTRQQTDRCNKDVNLRTNGQQTGANLPQCLVGNGLLFWSSLIIIIIIIIIIVIIIIII